MIHVYCRLQESCTASGDEKNAKFIKSRIDTLSARFISFEHEANRVERSVNVLVMSSADKEFFSALALNQKPKPTRNSHYLIQYAYDKLLELVWSVSNRQPSVEGKLDELETLQLVLESDFSVLHMVTGSAQDAYRLFQVINDRGTSLTDGDLLRAKTLELVEGYERIQHAVELLWDEILKDAPNVTYDYLNWIYESRLGARPQPSMFLDEFIKVFFPDTVNSLEEATKVLDELREISYDVEKCRKLKSGQWLYAEGMPITSWDRTRLSLLIVELGHSLCMPLLLSASKLDHRIFSEIVQCVERVFFRYKIICNLHVTPLKSIYYRESVAIRAEGDNYNTTNLRNSLKALLEEKATDELFVVNLGSLKYQDKGGSNKPLKYFLMSVEYYLDWYNAGAAGIPICLDKSRVYDFAGTSVEHIYPKNSAHDARDETLEPTKNSLGNLVIMDPAQNTRGGNQSFIDKKVLYSQSTVLMTRQVGMQAEWDVNSNMTHSAMLIGAAKAIFRV
jgi:hypothetical protein